MLQLADVEFELQVILPYWICSGNDGKSEFIEFISYFVKLNFFFSQACLRTFNKAQWQQLADRLQHWKSNLKRVNERLQTVTPPTR